MDIIFFESVLDGGGGKMFDMVSFSVIVAAFMFYDSSHPMEFDTDRTRDGLLRFEF
jgi:hypothetical protein